MSCANPVNRLGERGITACLVGGCCNPLRTPRAALKRDNNLPRMANSIINRCGSENNKQLVEKVFDLYLKLLTLLNTCTK